VTIGQKQSTIARRLIDDQLASALNGALQEFGAFRTTPTLTAAA
jgi:hypothetical protein